MATIGMIFFNRLSGKEKGELVVSKGTMIAHRHSGEYHIGLYKLSDFFVEFWIAKKNGEIESEIKTYSGRACLEPYLENINISDLIKE